MLHDVVNLELIPAIQLKAVSPQWPSGHSNFIVKSPWASISLHSWIWWHYIFLKMKKAVTKCQSSLSCLNLQLRPIPNTTQQYRKDGKKLASFLETGLEVHQELKYKHSSIRSRYPKFTHCTKRASSPQTFSWWRCGGSSKNVNSTNEYITKRNEVSVSKRHLQSQLHRYSEYPGYKNEPERPSVQKIEIWCMPTYGQWNTI